MAGVRVVEIPRPARDRYHPCRRGVDDDCRPGFQISPHAWQRQYVDDEMALLVVATRADSQNGHFVTGGEVASPVPTGLGDLSQRRKLIEDSGALMRDALERWGDDSGKQWNDCMAIRCWWQGH